MQKVCGVCGAGFEAQSGRAKFCSSVCRGRKHRGAAVIPLTGQRDQVSGAVVAATTAALEKVGRLAHPAGAAALVLAARLDSGEDTGSAMAAMAKELRSAVAEAVANAPQAADRVDELRQARERRLASS